MPPNPPAYEAANQSGTAPPVRQESIPELASQPAFQELRTSQPAHKANHPPPSVFNMKRALHERHMHLSSENIALNDERARFVEEKQRLFTAGQAVKDIRDSETGTRLKAERAREEARQLGEQVIRVRAELERSRGRNALLGEQHRELESAGQKQRVQEAAVLAELEKARAGKATAAQEHAAVETRKKAVQMEMEKAVREADLAKATMGQHASALQVARKEAYEQAGKAFEQRLGIADEHRRLLQNCKALQKHRNGLRREACQQEPVVNAIMAGPGSSGRQRLEGGGDALRICDVPGRAAREQE